MEAIYDKLKDMYYDCKNNILSVEEFKDGVKDFMQTDDAKKHFETLNTPRGLKAKTIIANILLACVALVPYAIGVICTGRFNLFQPNTDSKNRVDATVDSINTLKA